MVSLLTENQAGITADRVEYGEFFIDGMGSEGQMWAWVLQDTSAPYDAITNKYGSWIDGGDFYSCVHGGRNGFICRR
ncbi:MAG: hypothetical protein CM1200mP10_16440 [Candidatus Neomarinimicrobiota bacterium]|nr:MAG: hypothetical protein CM1200mP10_16440 [Candidatus Neomarinimicrobiota bacterium]